MTYEELRMLFETSVGLRIAVKQTWAEVEDDGTWSVYKLTKHTGLLHTEKLLSHDTFEAALSILVDEIHS